MHSLVKMHHYGDEATPCTVAMDICNGVADSAAWQLMESSMKELHERNRQRQLKLVELGLHPFQDDKVKAANSQRQLDLAARHEHPLQQSEVIEANRQREIDLAARHEHNFQDPEVQAASLAARMAGSKKKKKYRYTCSHEGCTNKAKKGGVCIRHGAKRN